MNNTTLNTLLVFSTFFSCAAACAANDNVDFHFSAEGEYDSSVGISELDEFTREGDSAWILKGGLKGRWQSNSIFSFSSHYEFTHHNYVSQNAYDQNMHHISLNPQWGFGKLKVSLRHDSVFVGLAGEDFMDYKLNSLAFEGSLSRAFYLRVAYNLADKTLQDYRERDADITAWSGDLFWFSESGKHLLSLSTKMSEENARVEQHDYDGKQWKLTYTRKFHLGNHATKFKLAHSLAKRRYHFTDIENFEARADNKQTNEISIESELSEKLALMASLELIDNNSNVASVDYQEEITTVGLRFTF